MASEKVMRIKQSIFFIIFEPKVMCGNYEGLQIKFVYDFCIQSWVLRPLTFCFRKISSLY